MGLAYERELAKSLESLGENFKRWRKNKISAFELSELSDSYAACYQVKEIRKEDILFEELVTGLR